MDPYFPGYAYTVIAAMTLHADNTQIQELGVVLLCNVTETTPRPRNIAAMCNVVTTALNNHVSSVVVQEHAVRIIELLSPVKEDRVSAASLYCCLPRSSMRSRLQRRTTSLLE